MKKYLATIDLPGKITKQKKPSWGFELMSVGSKHKELSH